MTITASDIYLLELYGNALNVIAGLIALLIVLAVTMGVMWLAFVSTPGDMDPCELRTLRRVRLGCIASAVLAVLLIFFDMFLPSRNTVIAMYVVPKITNNDIVQRDLPKYIREFLATEARRELEN